MGNVYGDSTPFPYDANFIDIIRDAVDCGVVLLLAQNALISSTEHVETFVQSRKTDKNHLMDIGKALKNTLLQTISKDSERSVRVATQIMDLAKDVIKKELALLEKQAAEEASQTHKKRQKARQKSFKALEFFLKRHLLPDTKIGIHINAEEREYSAQAHLITPFQTESTLLLQIPQGHIWEKPRRVGEFHANTDIHTPQLSGWISKRVEVQLVRLDKYFISKFSRTPEKIQLTLRRNFRTGQGFQFELTKQEGITRLALSEIIEEDGSVTLKPLPNLDFSDSSNIEQLIETLTNSSHDLLENRQSMIAANIEGKNILEHNEPKILCVALVDVLAPIVQEIAKRSGTEGELVLRRDLGEGRREEIYITKAELHEKIMTLPPEFAAIFEPLEFSSGKRSPRAPRVPPRLPTMGIEQDDSPEPTKIKQLKTNPT